MDPREVRRPRPPQPFLRWARSMVAQHLFASNHSRVEPASLLGSTSKRTEETRLNLRLLRMFSFRVPVLFKGLSTSSSSSSAAKVPCFR